MIIIPAPIPISHVAVEPPRPAQQQTPQETARPVVGPDEVEAISPEGRRHREGHPDDAHPERALPSTEAAPQTGAEPDEDGTGTAGGDVGRLLDLFV